MCQPVSDSSCTVVLSRHSLLHSCFLYHIHTVVPLSLVTFVSLFVTMNCAYMYDQSMLTMGRGVGRGVMPAPERPVMCRLIVFLSCLWCFIFQVVGLSLLFVSLYLALIYIQGACVCITPSFFFISSVCLPFFKFRLHALM